MSVSAPAAASAEKWELFIAGPPEGSLKRTTRVHEAFRAEPERALCSSVAFWIPLAVAVDVAAERGLVLHVDVGVGGDVVSRARADFQERCIGVAAIDEVMAVGCVLRKSSGVARLQDGFAVIVDQHDFAGEHVDEFILEIVP